MNPASADDTFNVAPLMRSVPALTTRPEGFFIAPQGGASSIAFGAAPAPNGGAMLCVAIQHGDGDMLVAAVPEELLPELTKKLNNALRQAKTRKFAQGGSEQ